MANKKRKCAFCKMYLPVEDGIIINISFFCSYDHATQQAIKNQPKVKARKDKAFRAETVRLKQGIKSISQLKMDYEKAVRRFIRARDIGKPCCSCNRPWQKGAHAGHFIAVGKCDYLRCNTKNIHIQCAHCNLHNHGAYQGYREFMIEKYGAAFTEELEWIKKTNPSNKQSREYLERGKDIFNRRALMYEKRHKKN